MAPGNLALPDEPDSPNRDSSKASSTGRPRSKASSRLTEFLERQSEPTPQYLIRRATSKVHRELVEDTRNADDAGLLGNQGPEGFRRLLSRKFGSVAAAWRVSLDPDGNGQISFGEFNHRCRQMGFTGNLRKLWGELDTEKTGFISLKEIDPKAVRRPIKSLKTSGPFAWTNTATCSTHGTTVSTSKTSLECPRRFSSRAARNWASKVTVTASSSFSELTGAVAS